MAQDHLGHFARIHPLTQTVIPACLRCVAAMLCSATRENSNMKKSPFLSVLLICAACGIASAQEQNPTATQHWPQQQQQPQEPEMRNGVPVFKITVVGRDIPAINYFHRSGSTKIGFQGTSLLPQGKGSAIVEGRRGRMVVDAKFEGLVPANSFGIEY